MNRAGAGKGWWSDQTDVRWSGRAFLVLGGVFLPVSILAVNSTTKVARRTCFTVTPKTSFGVAIGLSTSRSSASMSHRTSSAVQVASLPPKSETRHSSWEISPLRASSTSAASSSGYSSMRPRLQSSGMITGIPRRVLCKTNCFVLAQLS